MNIEKVNTIVSGTIGPGMKGEDRNPRARQGSTQRFMIQCSESEVGATSS